MAWAVVFLLGIVRMQRVKFSRNIWLVLLHGFQMRRPSTSCHSILNTHLGLCHTERQTCSSRNGRGGTGAPPGWMAGAAGWTGSHPRWESWVWWGRYAGRCRRTSTCGPSACRTGRRWQRHRGSTGSKLRRETTTLENWKIMWKLKTVQFLMFPVELNFVISVTLSVSHQSQILKEWFEFDIKYPWNSDNDLPLNRPCSVHIIFLATSFHFLAARFQFWLVEL